MDKCQQFNKDQEIEKLKDNLKTTTAEKIAIDQMYVTSIKEHLNLRTQNILLMENNYKLTKEIEELKLLQDKELKSSSRLEVVDGA